jgi:hypothetical protein
MQAVSSPNPSHSRKNRPGRYPTQTACKRPLRQHASAGNRHFKGRSLGLCLTARISRPRVPPSAVPSGFGSTTAALWEYAYTLGPGFGRACVPSLRRSFADESSHGIAIWRGESGFYWLERTASSSLESAHHVDPSLLAVVLA